MLKFKSLENKKKLLRWNKKKSYFVKDSFGEKKKNSGSKL